MIAERVFGDGGEKDFRWRGGHVSRVEALSDGVFALALTLIVVSLEAPSTYGELLELFVQAPVFAACFTVLLMVWFAHYRFHRRFGIEDLPTMLANFLLLLLVLLYVYPLRFMASFLYNSFVLQRRQPGSVLSWSQAQTLMIIYSAGFALIYAVFALLYACAWRKRAELELDSVERVYTKAEMHSHLLSAGVGVLSASIAAADASWTPLAGFAYFVMAPLHWVHGWSTQRAVERFRGKVPDAPRA